MIVMFDFDGCYAEHPKLWRSIAEAIQLAGHTCVMITASTEADREHLDIVVKGQMPILYAGDRAKRKVAREAGYEVDVWIEDNPIMVDFGVPGLTLVGEEH